MTFPAKTTQLVVYRSPRYFTMLPSSDYHLFRLVQSHLAGQEFTKVEDMRERVDNYFASKPTRFYRGAIFRLLSFVASKPTSGINLHTPFY